MASLLDQSYAAGDDLDLLYGPPSQDEHESDGDSVNAPIEDSSDDEENNLSEFEGFCKTFEPEQDDQETPLHKLARRPDAFSDHKGRDLLHLLLRDRIDYLEERGDYLRPKYPLHVAIETSNEPFLEAFLELFDVEGFDNDKLSEALEMVNNTHEKSNCLHSAITKRLACAATMVSKCTGKALEMVDGYNNTLLHLAMNQGRRDRDTAQQPADIIQERAFPNISKVRSSKAVHDSMPARAFGEGMGQGDANVGIFTGKPFHPADILEKMKNFQHPGCPRNSFVAKLLAATNNAGMSPYQVRLQAFKQPSVKEQKLREELRDVQKKMDKAKKVSTGSKNTDDDGAVVSAKKKKIDKQQKLQEELEGVLNQNQEEKDFQRDLKQLIFDCHSEISDIRKALYGTLGLEKELCLDMSDFNQSSHDFNRFITQLTQHSRVDNLQFEETLYYIYLPDLNTFKKPCPHDGVRSLFEWLSGQKGVQIIKNLNMPDNTTSPMSDELVKDAIINRFHIEKLDWRKLDINLDTLTTSNHAAHFLDLTLYSSGNWSVLYHWVSRDGLEKLEQLKKVTINIMELNPQMHDNKAQTHHNTLIGQYKDELDLRFEKMKKEKEVKGIVFEYKVNVDGKWDFPVLEYSDDEDPFVPNLKIFEQLSRCHSILRDLKKSEESQIKIYAKRFENLTEKPDRHEPDRRLKVAIIDNGADKIRSSVKTNIAKGVSFVTADSESRTRILPWWTVADPHGTQMASLIKKANPFCQLYIARVGKGRKDILPENAAKAVLWAIEQKVDIISMSWITKKDVPALREAIAKAVKQDVLDRRPILAFCSTADEGVYSGEVYPACYPDTVNIAATDIYGHIRPASKAGVNVLVPGEDIMADGPSYMGQFTVGTVSGSSVATALASGIASLALLLLRTFNEVDDEKMREYLTKDGIMRIFSKMNCETNGIQLFDLFPDDSKQLPEVWDIINFPELKRKAGT